MSDELRAAEKMHTSLKRRLEDDDADKWDIRKQCFMSAGFQLRHWSTDMATLEQVKSKVYKQWTSELPALEDALHGLPEKFRPASAVKIIEANLQSMNVTTDTIVKELQYQTTEAKKKVDEIKKSVP